MRKTPSGPYVNEYTSPGDTIMIYGDFFELYEIDSLNAVVDLMVKFRR